MLYRALVITEKSKVFDDWYGTKMDIVATCEKKKQHENNVWGGRQHSFDALQLKKLASQYQEIGN